MRPHVAAQLGRRPGRRVLGVRLDADRQRLDLAGVPRRPPRRHAGRRQGAAARPRRARSSSTARRSCRSPASSSGARRSGCRCGPADLAEEFIESVGEELDFGIEAVNGAQLADALADVPGVRIPRIYPELSGRRIMTQELDRRPQHRSAHRRRHLRRRRRPRRPRRPPDQRVPAPDLHHRHRSTPIPHPGNILVEPDGTIVLIDLGAVGRLGAGHREAVLDMLAAASMGNAAGLRQALGQITLFDRRVDLRQLEMALESFLAKHLRSGGGIDAAAFEDLTVLIGQYGIRLPRWFGTLSRTLVTLEGTLKGLDPTFSLVDAAKRHARRDAARPRRRRSAGAAAARADRRAAAPAADARAGRRAPRPGRHRAAVGAAVAVRRRARRAARHPTRQPPRARPDRGRRRRSRRCSCSVSTPARPSARSTSTRCSATSGWRPSAVLAFRVVAGIIRDGET